MAQYHFSTGSEDRTFLVNMMKDLHLSFTEAEGKYDDETVFTITAETPAEIKGAEKVVDYISDLEIKETEKALANARPRR